MHVVLPTNQTKRVIHPSANTVEIKWGMEYEEFLDKGGPLIALTKKLYTQDQVGVK